MGGTMNSRAENAKSDIPRPSGGDPLAFMYLIAAFLMAAGSVVVILLMISAGRQDTNALDDPEVWVPGASPDWAPLAGAARTFEPPGVTQTGHNTYVANIVAYNWVFRPNEVRVPAGSEVTFRVRSEEDYHGLALVGTSMILSFMQNEVSEGVYTFTEPGEYPWVCSEYCGGGHVSMNGRVIVE